MYDTCIRQPPPLSSPAHVRTVLVLIEKDLPVGTLGVLVSPSTPNQLSGSSARMDSSAKHRVDPMDPPRGLSKEKVRRESFHEAISISEGWREGRGKEGVGG